MKILKGEKITRFLFGILTLVLSFAFVGASAFSLIKATVLNGDFVKDTMNSTSYYTDLCDEIKSDLVNLGSASGLKESFFSDFVDEVTVREDVEAYVDKFYSGEKLTVDTTNFQQELTSAIEKYEKKQHIDTSTISEESVNYFISEAAKIYSEDVKVKYFNMIQKTQLQWQNKVLIYSAIFILVAVAIILFVIFVNKWKHLALKYLYFSTISSGVFMALVPTVVKCTGIINKITIINRSLNDLFNGVVNSLMMDMYIIACVLIVVSFVMLILSFKLRKKATA